MTTPLMSLNASAAHEWLTCPEQATHKYILKRRAELDYEPVAIRFGNTVHSMVTGEALDMSKPVEYDLHTQDMRQLGYQAQMATDLLERALDDIEEEYPAWYFNTKYERGAQIGDVHIRVVGITDCVGVNDKDEANIVDLKTGATPLPNHYLAQLAIYCWLMDKDKDREDVFKPVRSTLIHVNRRLLERGEEAVTIMSRPAEPLIEMGGRIVRHTIHAMSAPSANPGQHCDYCENKDCVYHPEWEPIW